MGKTREIKRRIKAVGNIRRITKTMQMIATAKFSASQSRAVASKPYTKALFALVGELTGGLGDVSHPLLTTSGSGQELTLIITSDRGLCGPYNSSLLRTAMQFFRGSETAKSGLIELVGKKGAGALKYNRIPVAKQHSQFGDKPTYDAVEALAQDFINRFSTGEISTVRVIYMQFLSAGRQRPEVLQLLPFKPAAAGEHAHAGEAEAKAKAQYEFSPAPKELLDDLLPAAVKATLFQCFMDANVSENVARMVAMKAATDNAGKMGKRLTRMYNRARQAQITTELTEIISGAAALA
ncbi:MAG: ATP synthase F1 subunit gamma [Phycisphaerales bacterium]